MSDPLPESASTEDAQPSPLSRPVSFLWREGQAAWNPGSQADDRYLAAVVRREQLAGVLAGVPAAAVFMVAFAGATLYITPDLGLFAWVAAVLIGVPFLLYAIRPGVWGRWKKQMDQSRARSKGNAYRLSVLLKPDGIFYETENASVLYRWKAFEDVRRLPEHVAIDWADSRGAMLVPETAFASREDADLWCLTAQRALDAAGHGPDERAKEILNAYTVCCGKCGQQLRGLRVRRCPECGETFTVHTLRLWHALRKPIWRMTFERLGIGRAPSSGV